MVGLGGRDARKEWHPPLSRTSPAVGAGPRASDGSHPSRSPVLLARSRGRIVVATPDIPRVLPLLSPLLLSLLLRQRQRDGQLFPSRLDQPCGPPLGLGEGLGCLRLGAASRGHRRLEPLAGRVGELGRLRLDLGQDRSGAVAGCRDDLDGTSTLLLRLSAQGSRKRLGIADQLLSVAGRVRLDSPESAAAISSAPATRPSSAGRASGSPTARELRPCRRPTPITASSTEDYLRVAKETTTCGW